MQYHDHVTHKWPRCSIVELLGEDLVYAVDWDRAYNLADNRSQLHVRFLNLKSDEELVAFTRAWGPLWQATPARIIVPKSGYWAFQRRLKVGLELAQNAVSYDANALKIAIFEYLAAERSEQASIGKSDERGGTASFLSLLYTGKEQNPEEWIPGATLAVLRRAAADCLCGNFSFSLNPEWKRGKLCYSWKPHLPTLASVIELDSWNSLTGVRPVTICDECRTVFLPDSAHTRKFCSYRCAHRAAMRTWRKNNAGEQSKRKRGDHAKAKKI